MKLNFLFLILFPLLMSCSFSSEEGGDLGGGGSPDIVQNTLNPVEDIDGDFKTNQEEEEAGTNPFVSDIPRMDLYLSQKIDFEIEMNHEGDELNKSFSYGPNTYDAGFRKLIGRPLLKRKFKEKAASIARIPNHSIGEFLEDPDMYEIEGFNTFWRMKKSLELAPFESSKIHNIFTRFELNLSLLKYSYFDSISDVEISIFSRDMTEKRFNLLKEIKIDRILQKGLIETLSVELSIDKKILFENILNGDEFLYFKVKNFYIPSLNTDLKTLKNSIKQKTIPVVLEGPFGIHQFFVSTKNNLTFEGILKTIFPDNYEIRDNVLFKIREWENSFSVPDDLSSLRNLENAGRWFVLSNVMDQNLYAHMFKSNDSLVLTYKLGHEISKVKEKVTKSKGFNQVTNDNFIDLGKLSKTGKAKFFLNTITSFGERYSTQTDRIEGLRNCGSNCYGKDVTCFLEINRIYEFEEEPTGLNLDQVSLIYKNREVSLESIKDKINLKINAGEIYFEILDPRKLFSIDETSQNDSETLYFKFNSLETDVFEGVVITNMVGAHFGLCPNLSAMYAHSISLPLNEHSFRISEWDHLLNWERVGRGKKLKLTEKTKFEFKSEIIKYFN